MKLYRRILNKIVRIIEKWMILMTDRATCGDKSTALAARIECCGRAMGVTRFYYPQKY